MMRTRTVYGDRYAMGFRCIPFMNLEAIRGKLAGKLGHQPIACHLGDHAGGRNRLYREVSSNNSALRDSDSRNRPRVDQNVVDGLKPLHRPTHREQIGSSNLKPRDLLDARDPDTHATALSMMRG